MSEELKPCPFCNAEITMGNICSIENYNTGEENSFHVICKSCLCETQHFDSDQEAIEAWNKRVIPKGYVKFEDVYNAMLNVFGMKYGYLSKFENKLMKEIKKLEGER